MISVCCFSLAIIFFQAVAVQSQLPPDIGPPGGGPPGGGPPGGGPAPGTGNTCLDLAFMIDVSCSVDNDDMERAVDFAKTVLKNLNSAMTEDRDTTVRVAVGIFIDRVHKIFYLNEYTENEVAIMDALEAAKQKLKPEIMKCKTNTHYAINALNSEYFQEANGDRDNAKYPNAAVIITDARTMSRKAVNNGHLGRYLDNARNLGNVLYTVLVENNRNRPPLDDALLTGNDTSKLFDIRTGNDNAEAVRLANVLKDNTCPFDPERAEKDVCADIIFAIDVSCSITSDDKDLSTYVASEVYKKVFAETRNYGIGTSLLVFDNHTRASFLKTNTDPLFDDFVALIRGADVSNHACRTMPEKMFQKVDDLELDQQSEPDPDKPNRSIAINMVLYSDGMTAPINRRGKTIIGADAFKKKLGTELLLVKLKNNRGKDGNSEFTRVPTSKDAHLFPQNGFLNDANKDIVAQDIADLIIAGLNCPEEDKK